MKNSLSHSHRTPLKISTPYTVVDKKLLEFLYSKNIKIHIQNSKSHRTLSIAYTIKNSILPKTN